MKKVCVFLTVVGCLIGVASANALDWSFAAKTTASQSATSVNLTGWTAYLLGTADWNASDSTASIAKAVDSATIAKTGTGVWGTSTYSVTTGSQTLTLSDLAGTSKTYQMIISDGNSYLDVGTVSGTVYDPTDPTSVGVAISKAMQGSTGYPKLSNVSAMTGGGTPEPTSGLLLLVGGAILALRRKQK